MRCQDVERLILEDRGPGLEDRAKVDAHLAECARCSDWREFWRTLRESVTGSPAPELPPSLAERVRQAAHAAILSRSGGGTSRARAQARPALPGFIWAAFAAITVLTLGFLMPGVRDFIDNQKLTLGTALVLILILQNTVTLFFAPVALRRGRHLQGGQI
jgi:anti-sigma factor RsiW